jgi:hypothetical protein
VITRPLAHGDPSVHPVARASTTSTPPVRKPSRLSLAEATKLPKQLSLVKTLGVAVLVAAALVPSAYAAGDANRPSCPTATEASPGFRQTLPDCRAYELVTPAFKFGLPPLNGGFFLDESHLTFSSIGGFAEAEEDATALGSTYLATRNPPAWGTTPIDLPASQFRGSLGLEGEERLLDVSADFSKVLSVNVPAGAKAVDDRFYLREAAHPDGSCPNGATRLAVAAPGACAVEVGPASSPSVVTGLAGLHINPDIRYDGASRDLSHVFANLLAFRPLGGGKAFEERWPGDTTVNNSALYEYSGTGDSEPKLVAVKNPHALASDREAEPIGQCGSALGGHLREGTSNPENTYNAISSDGSRVFFTVAKGGCPNEEAPGSEEVGEGPPVNEIYLRLEGSHTLAISEPPLSVPGRECTGACAEDETIGAKRSEGVFVGASADGSKVFFLTRQPMVDADEGGSGTGQDLYEAKIEGSGASAKVGRLTQVSHDPAPGEPANVLGVVHVSPGGTRVYYVAQGVLANNPDAKGETAKAGADNLYVYEPDPARPGQFKTVFITTLGEADSGAWEGQHAEVTPATARSSDGEFLLLSSSNDLTPDAKGNGTQLYRYDAEREQLARISVGQCPSPALTCGPSERFNDNEEESFFNIELPPSGGEIALAGPQRVAISNDGAYVFFSSRTALTPLAQSKQIIACEEKEENGECPSPIRAGNIYEYHEGNTYLISDGQDRNATLSHSTTTLIGASPSGHDVYFTSGDPLVANDTDTQEDIYDARIEGGLPGPPTSGACTGEACRGAASSPPELGLPGSATFSGPGNLTPPTPGVVKPKPRVQTRAQLLAKALRACHKKPRRLRHACKARAQRRYGPKSKAGRRRHGRSK